MSAPSNALEARLRAAEAALSEKGLAPADYERALVHVMMGMTADEACRTVSLARRAEGLIERQGGGVFINSHRVAEFFGRPHGRVLSCIEKIRATLPADSRHRQEFIAITYLDPAYRVRPAYRIGWRGFSLLATTFEGRGVYAKKQAALRAFFRAEELAGIRT